MQIRPVLRNFVARAANLGAQALGGVAGITFWGAIYLVDLRDRFTKGGPATAPNTGQGLQSRAARFAASGPGPRGT